MQSSLQTKNALSDYHAFGQAQRLLLRGTLTVNSWPGPSTGNECRTAAVQPRLLGRPNQLLDFSLLKKRQGAHF